MTTVTMRLGADSVTIRTPQYRYIALLNMGLHYAKTTYGYSVWDDGLGYDYRTCKVSKWLLDSDECQALNAFLTTTSRGLPFTLDLGDTPSGFFPFGPDYGDCGEFTVQLIDFNLSGILFDPKKFFNASVELRCIAHPTYTPADPIQQGNLRIGRVSGLPTPQVEVSPDCYASTVTVSRRGGALSVIDLGVPADRSETKFELALNTSNAAALVAELQYIRADDCSIVTPVNSYLFGVPGGGSGTYITKQLSPTLNITHQGCNRFSTALNCWLKGIS